MKLGKNRLFNMISAEKKAQYWNHFTDKSRSVYRPKQITDIRLWLIKEIIFCDDFLWHDLVAHNYVLDKTPNELNEASPLNYKNARANFWAMIRKGYGVNRRIKSNARKIYLLFSPYFTALTAIFQKLSNRKLAPNIKIPANA